MSCLHTVRDQVAYKRSLRRPRTGQAEDLTVRWVSRVAFVLREGSSLKSQDRVVTSPFLCVANIQLCQAPSGFH